LLTLSQGLPTSTVLCVSQGRFYLGIVDNELFSVYTLPRHALPYDETPAAPAALQEIFHHPRYLSADDRGHPEIMHFRLFLRDSVLHVMSAWEQDHPDEEEPQASFQLVVAFDLQAVDGHSPQETKHTLFLDRRFIMPEDVVENEQPPRFVSFSDDLANLFLFQVYNRTAGTWDSRELLLVSFSPIEDNRTKHTSQLWLLLVSALITQHAVRSPFVSTGLPARTQLETRQVRMCGLHPWNRLSAGGRAAASAVPCMTKRSWSVT
jgi:hypothetical protein